MTTYAIGDVQGCFDALQALLEKIRFDPSRDTLWFTGDLVNRGPQSLETLRFVSGLGKRAVTVLGNHDLHLLAVASGTAKRKKQDTLDEVLTAPDGGPLLDWLRHRPLLHHDVALGWTLVHAGLLPQWDLAEAQQLAREAEIVLRSDAADNFLANMYGDLPDRWHENLAGHERLRVIVNAFTRLRYCDPEGKMELHFKGAPGSQPPGLVPWFQAPHRRSGAEHIVFGHWSTLGAHQDHGVLGLDGGCLWGRELCGARLEPGATQILSVRCRNYRRPDAV